MGTFYGNTSIKSVSSISTSNLVLWLDAGNSSSYPGTGTTWTDLSGQGNNFAISASAYNSTGPKYMDFNGSYGCAKKQTSDLVLSGDVTCICWTRILNSTSNWRTLLRGLSSGPDHQVIIQTGGYLIGMYDNTTGTGFNSSGALQTEIPGYSTGKWNMLYWRWSNTTSPYYSFGYNDSTNTIKGSNSATASKFKGGVCSIGSHNNNEQNTPTTASQYWGDIAFIALYNRILTDKEIALFYLNQKSRYGL